MAPAVPISLSSNYRVCPLWASIVHIGQWWRFSLAIFSQGEEADKKEYDDVDKRDDKFKDEEWN